MLPKITHTELPDFIRLAMATNENLLVVSAPGIGKTVSTVQYSADNNLDCIISHPAVWDPTDAKGLPAKSKMKIPVVEDNNSLSEFEELDDILADLGNSAPEQSKVKFEEIDVAKFLPFDDLLTIMIATKPTIWIWDDFGQAPGSVQAAMMQLLGSRELNGKKIPNCVHIVALTNGREHKAGVKGLLEPVKSRFGLIVELVPDLGSFRGFMLGKGYSTSITDYLNYQPGALLDFKTDLGMENSPCPRLWEKIGKYMGTVTDHNTAFFRKVCESCIGETYGKAFHSFLKIYKLLPTYAEIIGDAEDYPLDQQLDVRYAMLGMIANQAKQEHHVEVFKFINRLAKEYQIIFINTLTAMKSDLCKTPSMRNWMASNSDLYMQALKSSDSNW